MNNRVVYPYTQILKGFFTVLRGFSSGIRGCWAEQGGSFLLIFFWILVTIAPMLEQDYPINHSSHFNLSWAFQYQRQFFGGQVYPRWLEYSNFGFGNATFVFYPPLSFAATLLFAALHWSVSSSLVGSMAMALLMFSLGFYGYATCFFKKSTSLLLTIVSVCNPYLLIDVYQRGTVAEVWGIVWTPWILWFTHKLVLSASSSNLIFSNLSLKRSFYILGLTLSYSFLILSHLPTLLIFTLVWMVLPWCLSGYNAQTSQKKESRKKESQKEEYQQESKQKQKFGKQGILESYASFVLAIGLSSFYLLPAWLDQFRIQTENLHPDADYYPQNRLLITGLTDFLPKLSTHWFDKMIVPYAILVIIIFFLGILAWFIAQKDDRRSSFHQGAILWWCITLLVAIVMVTDLGRVFYVLPLMQKIQFSWRWLSVTVVPISLLLGYIYPVFLRQGKRFLDQCLVQFSDQGLDRSSPNSFLRTKIAHTLIQILTLGLTFFLGLVLFVQGNQIMNQTHFDATEIETFNTLLSQKNFPQEPHIPPQTPLLNWHIRFQDGLGLGDVYEYRSREINLSLPPSAPYPLAQWVNPGSGTIEIQGWQYGKRSLRVTNGTDQVQRLRLRLLYYPGWQFRLDQSLWQTILTSDQGVAEIAIPPGSHKAIVAYRGTPAEVWGRGLTLAVLGLFLWILVRATLNLKICEG